MAQENPSTPLTEPIKNTTFLRITQPIPGPAAWTYRRPRTRQPAQLKLDNRALKKGYLC